MSVIPSIPGLFKWRQFEPEVILLAIGWYLRFRPPDPTAAGPPRGLFHFH